MNKTFLVILQIVFLITSCTEAQEVTFEITNSMKNAELFQLEGEKTFKHDSVFLKTENSTFP